MCLTGEAGIGKTRVAHELAAIAAGTGFDVHHGCSYEGEGAPPYWPWVELLRSLIRPGGFEALREQLGAGAELLASLLPELAGEAAPAAPPEGETARFQLVDAVTRLITARARTHPLLLVLDDLHWADPSSVRVLEFFAREVSRAPVLLVVASRSPAAEGNDALATSLSRLGRHDAFLRCPLEGLGREEVAALARSLTGRAPTRALLDFLLGKTAGNPFFVKELVLLLAASDRLAAPPAPHEAGAVPDTVRSVLRERLKRLPDRCLEALALAAVIGARFDLRLLGEAAGREPAALARDLAPARAAQLVEEGADGHGLHFTHPLIRDALLLESGPEERRALHRRVGAVLEGRADRDEAVMGALARHFLAAVPDVDVAQAIDYGRRAAAHARRVLAFEEAEEITRRVLRLVGPDDAPTRSLLLYELGSAQLRAGRTEQARASTLQAVELARATGDGALLARAALQYASGQLVVGVRNAPVLSLLEEALEALPAGDPQRALLLSQLAIFCLSAEDHARAAPLVAQALHEARRGGDREGELAAMAAELYVLGGPGNVQARIDAADRLIAHAGSQDTHFTIAFARNYRLLALLEKGDLAAVDRAIEELEQAAEQHHDHAARPFALRFRAMRALLEGRLEEAEARCMQAFELAREMGLGDTAAMNMAAQTFMIRRHQGRLAELEGMLVGFVEQYPDFASWRSALAVLYVELGRLEDARLVLRSLVERVPALPRDVTWLTVVSGLGEVCGIVGERESAGLFYELLLPFADSQVVVGNGDTTTGSVSRTLGLLAGCLGREDDAVRHFEDAIAMNRRMGARPFLAYAITDLARLWRRRGEGARAEALELEARSIAEAVGMPALLARLEPAETEEVELPGARARTGVFREEGDHWRVGLDGHGTHLRDSRGLQQIARLLREPGRELHVLDLVNPGTGLAKARSVADLGAVRPGGAGEQLDAVARAQYRERLLALREDLEEAERRNDCGRSERAQQEIAFLERELARGFGLGGRPRPAVSEAERARVNVKRTIERALQRIRSADPPLARVLDRGLRTGLFCRYEPDPDFPIEWKL